MTVVEMSRRMTRAEFAAWAALAHMEAAEGVQDALDRDAAAGVAAALAARRRGRS